MIKKLNENEKEKKKKSTKRIKIPDIKKENSDKKDKKIERIGTNVDYSCGETFHGQLPDSEKLLDYAALFSYETEKRDDREEEYTPLTINDTKNETLTVEEAKEQYNKIQISAALGSYQEMNFTEKRKFSHFIKFNPEFFKHLESMYAITRDVNYNDY